MLLDQRVSIGMKCKSEYQIETFKILNMLLLLFKLHLVVLIYCGSVLISE